MKLLLVAIFAFSSVAMAQTLDATEALSQVLPVGHFTGLTPEGYECAVQVAKGSDGITTTATAEGEVLSRTVENGSVYRWNPGTRFFLSSEKTYSRDGVNSVEQVLRTLAVDTFTQYVVVARVIVNNREVREDKIECVVNLQ